jgi:hypothetical protein
MNREKPYSIETEFRGDYLWALVRGERLTTDIAESYWDEIAALCREKNCEKILIEKDFKIPVGPEDMILMADHLAKILPECRIAFIDRRHHDVINELGKRLARNHQLMMQVFSDTDAAEKWLLAN